MPLALGDGRTLAWSEGGDPAGTPVLFFHGCPDTRRAAWTGHDAAHAAGVRLIAANRPGYGASTPASPSYELVVGDVAELADSLGLDRFAVIGMSVGGTFALACAARLPYRVTTAALVATTDGRDAAGQRGLGRALGQTVTAVVTPCRTGISARSVTQSIRPVRSNWASAHKGSSSR